MRADKRETSGEFHNICLLCLIANFSNSSPVVVRVGASSERCLSKAMPSSTDGESLPYPEDAAETTKKKPNRCGEMLNHSLRRCEWS